MLHHSVVWEYLTLTDACKNGTWDITSAANKLQVQERLSV